MTPLRQRMIEDMQLRGLAPLTQRAYLRAVQELACYYRKSPDQISEDELRQYFLSLHHEQHLARSPTIVHLCGIKFLFEHTLRQPWPSLELLRPRPVHRLPVVLSAEEVWQILAQLRRPTYRACLSTIYTCGLRLHEGASLRVEQIDSRRMQLLIRGGKGNKDRNVPLPPRTLALLRTHWVTHRNPRLLKKSTAYRTISSSKEEPMLRASYAPLLSDQDQLIFETLVPSDHYLRRVNAVVDFERYRATMAACSRTTDGRPADDPVVLLKVGFLQTHYNLSDREVLAAAQVNVAFRAFR